MNILRRLFAAIVAIASAYLLVMGAKLVFVGGSPYYALIGLTYSVSAWLMWHQDRRSAHLVAAALLATVAWAFWEVGSAYWSWLPRLLVPLGFCIIAMLLFASPKDNIGKVMLSATAAGVIVFVGFLARGFINVPLIENVHGGSYRIAESDNAPIDWAAYSRDTMGIRYSPFTQINRNNVKDLQLAWTYRTGRDQTDPNKVDQNTPLQIENALYACTPENAVHAINATTGERKWVFDPKASANAWQRCRGLGYYKDVASPSEQICHERIIGNTVDGRLFSLDVRTGTLCPGFGDKGVVDLRKGMGDEGAGYYYQTSAPLVAKDKIVIGGWIADNQKIGEPSGAIRAFDVKTGALLWAWDPGDPGIDRAPVPGRSYTLGTPNMWTHAAYDPDLDMIYAPMGNAGTDYYNADRPEHSLKYNAAIVALNGATGRPKWSFQTVHDDLWDYDIPSQPALLDMKNEKREVVPALVVLTKRGQIFALDRRDGTPIARVEERAVPTKGSIPENRVSPTQPYSVDMPQLGVGPLTEASSWGMTMFDQLLCRISFNEMRYDGDFTLPGLGKKALTYPGALGGFNWGSASYDPVNKLLFVNDIRLPNTKLLLTRAQYDEIAKTRKPTPDGHGLGPMAGTPYAIVADLWQTPLGVPCLHPPLGTVTAIDLETREIAWQVPAGTASELGPLGIKLGLPMTMGMPTYAGTTVTAGGIVFFAGTQDYYLRAYDAETGRELLKLPLPVGASATPMVFVSPQNGKEYVVLSVGGSAHSPDTGDYLLAFALPGNAPK
ncbi:TPA: membrane-bound PQQ-dependent dehydrogenase, glucose/quinate/shikimate family [Pseudomonas aeruginosa]|nr:membrane-bound PQQ-dependent dehydrogenase, glucose/quinate/shikimate family [Pseudomonas aeruginosa]HCF3508254.1 membrane-bound PQQ-dependent dehydrogenase, glucose/quinate/shikimate family [Pseudomonas aeruginosa]